MVYIILAGNLLLFFIASMLLSKLFYFYGVKKKTISILKRTNIRLEELHYSLDHLIYFVPIPCHNPIFQNLKREQLYIKKDYASIMFGKIVGIQVHAQTSNDDNYLVAYMAVDKMAFPQLSEQIMNGSLTKEEAKTINEFKSIHPSTVSEILDEVYHTISFRPQ